MRLVAKIALALTEALARCGGRDAGWIAAFGWGVLQAEPKDAPEDLAALIAAVGVTGIAAERAHAAFFNAAYPDEATDPARIRDLRAESAFADMEARAALAAYFRAREKADGRDVFATYAAARKGEAA